LKHVDINMICVGWESFTSTDTNKMLQAISITRSIYGQVDFGIGAVNWYSISNADAGAKATIDSQSEAEDLTDDWTVPNEALDVFIVRVMNGADGWSAVGGSCDKNGKGMTGSVVSLNGTVANVGNTLAHEMGHYLGLSHIPDAGNFIGGNGSSDSWTGIYSWQGDKMKTHCFVRS